MDIQSPKEWVIEPSAGRCPAAGGPTRAFGVGHGGVAPEVF